jgi:predicted RNase H-like nuclease (RuvC/YqgF family)
MCSLATNLELQNTSSRRSMMAWEMSGEPSLAEAQKPQAAAGEKVAAATGIAGNPKGGVAVQGKRAAEKAKKAAKKAAEEAYPDTEGVRAAKEKVEKQGAIVRDLKAKKGESQDEIEELEKAVKELLSLKDDLAAEVEKAKAAERQLRLLHLQLDGPID